MKKDEFKVFFGDDHMTLSSNPFLVGRLAKEISKHKKEQKMKTKKFYHTFDYKGREITFLLYVEEDKGHPFLKSPETATLTLTYSVRLHEDKEIEGLTKKILLGRLEKGKHLEQFSTSTRFGFKLAYLKGLAFCFENELKRGELVIAGMEAALAKETVSVDEQVEEKGW